MKNVELLVRTLEQAGVRWVFGVPSGPVLPLIEALRVSSVDYILTASETSAGFMAATVGGLTGIPGVCVSTLGPGATNLATGVGCAWLDRTPLIAITCNVATDWIERRVQMRIDHHALYKPITKSTFPLRSAGFADTLAEAIMIAKHEPPGPVHLDLPEDVGLVETSECPIEKNVQPKMPEIPEASLSQVLASTCLRVVCKSNRAAVGRNEVSVAGMACTSQERASLGYQFSMKKKLIEIF